MLIREAQKNCAAAAAAASGVTTGGSGSSSSLVTHNTTKKSSSSSSISCDQGNYVENIKYICVFRFTYHNG